MMRDRQGRTIRYLRLSLTRACPMRCVYCRPATLALSHDHSLMSGDEIEALVRHLVEHHGVRKVRLTGGEPTTRPDLLDIIARLARITGLHELGLTTNGLTLSRQAQDLARAGLCRVNVSLDSLDRRAFARITGVDGLERVLAGIDAAREAGLQPVKLNTVVVAGENDTELDRLLLFAADRDCDIRFIELMPMGPLASQWADRFVPEAQMRDALAGVVVGWRMLSRGSESARRYRATLADGRQVTVGFITAMSCDFCASCDRLRIAADGTVYPCLMDAPTGNVMRAIRPRLDHEALDRLLTQCLAHKRSSHPAVGSAVMVTVGG